MKAMFKTDSMFIRPAILLIGLLLVATMVAIPLLGASSSEKVTLQDISGDVFVEKDGSKQEIKATNNMEITEGDTIHTGEKAYTRLVFDEHNAVSIGENTTITLAQLANEKGTKTTKIKQSSGKVWNKVKQTDLTKETYRVETPDSIMGVKGTMFLIEHDGDRTTLSVLDGVVGATPVDREGRETGEERSVDPYEQYIINESESDPPTVLDIDSIAGVVEIDLIVDMINDLLTEADESKKDAQQSLGEYERSNEDESVLHSMERMQRAQYLARVAEQILKKEQHSARSQELNQKLSERGQSKEQIAQRITDQLEDIQQAQKRVHEAVRQVNLTDRRINDRIGAIQERIDKIREEMSAQRPPVNPRKGNETDERGSGFTPSPSVPPVLDPPRPRPPAPVVPPGFQLPDRPELDRPIPQPPIPELPEPELDPPEPEVPTPDPPAPEVPEPDPPIPEPPTEPSETLPDAVKSSTPPKPIQAVQGEAFSFTVMLKGGDGEGIENVLSNEFSLDTSTVKLVSVQDEGQGRYLITAKAIEPPIENTVFHITVRGITLRGGITVMFRSPTGTVTGEVYDLCPECEIKSIPLEKIPLQIWKDEELVAEGITDPEGIYDIEIPTGKGYRITAKFNGYSYENYVYEGEIQALPGFILEEILEQLPDATPHTFDVVLDESIHLAPFYLLYDFDEGPGDGGSGNYDNIGNLEVTDVTNHSITVAWDPYVMDHFRHYRCLINGEEVGYVESNETDQTTFTFQYTNGPWNHEDEGAKYLEPNTTYEIRIEAFEKSADFPSAVATINVTTEEDLEGWPGHPD